MGTLRILKKEVNNLTQEFISDAFAVIGSHPDHREPVIDIISDVVGIRNETIGKINHPEVQEGGSMRKTLKEIRSHFLQELDSRYRELSKVTSGRKKTSGSRTPSKSGAKKENVNKAEKPAE